MRRSRCSLVNRLSTHSASGICRRVRSTVFWIFRRAAARITLHPRHTCHLHRRCHLVPFGNSGKRGKPQTAQGASNAAQPLSPSEDLDVLLIGPTGKYVTLMSDAGGGNSLDNVMLTFDDSSPQLPKDAKIVSGFIAHSIFYAARAECGG